MEKVLFGLSCTSTNQEIVDLVFDKAHEVRYFSMATLQPNGSKTPGVRYLDFMRCEDDGLIYFGVGTGKACNEDLEENPIVALNGAFVGEDNGESEHRMLISFRITGEAKIATNKKAFDEYWKRNPGSKKMWSRSPDSFVIYYIPNGEGELYQVYKNDRIYRLRFQFGTESVRPFKYQTNFDLCVGCGVCQNACTANIIEIQNKKAVIPYHHCYECGVCYHACPNHAIIKY